MCPIIAAGATALMGGLQAVAEYQGQKQQAAAVKQAAIADYEQKSSDTTRRQLQEDDAANQKIALSNIEEAKQGAELEVSAAQGGVSGISLDNLHADVARTNAQNRETARENARMVAEQLQNEKKGARADAQGRIAATPKPSALSLVAGLGTAALSGYNSYKKMT